MKINPYQALFEQRDVVAITGLKTATLQNWANRRIISLDKPSPGKAWKRLYSVLDIYKVAFLRAMGRLGLNPYDAAHFFIHIKDQIKKAYEEDNWNFGSWDYQMCLFICPDPSEEDKYISSHYYWSVRTGSFTSEPGTDGCIEQKLVNISLPESALFFKASAFLSRIHSKIVDALEAKERRKRIFQSMIKKPK